MPGCDDWGDARFTSNDFFQFINGIDWKLQDGFSDANRVVTPQGLDRLQYIYRLSRKDTG